MRFEIVTTGQGMMEPGVIVGNIEADTRIAALEALKKFLGGRPIIWELK